MVAGVATRVRHKPIQRRDNLPDASGRWVFDAHRPLYRQRQHLRHLAPSRETIAGRGRCSVSRFTPCPPARALLDRLFASLAGFDRRRALRGDSERQVDGAASNPQALRQARALRKNRAGNRSRRDGDIVKGFEIDDDSYVVLEPEELEEIKLESSRAIELAQFVDRAEIDPRYFEKPYYVVPEGDVSTEGFIVIREALTSTGKVELGKLTMRGREELVAVMPFGKGLLLETLRYQNELRAADPNFADIPDLKVDEEMIELATELIRRKSRPFDPARFTDAYAEALKQLVERKRAGRAIITTGEEERREPGKVINLIEALKKSVGQDAPRRPPTERGRGGAKNASEPRGAGRSKSTSWSGKTSPAKKRA